MKLINEIPNKAVITLRSIINRNFEITRVSYDEDGDWQFLHGGNLSESDAMVVSVREILKFDQTLTELPDLLKGESATRITKLNSWVKSNQ